MAIDEKTNDEIKTEEQMGWYTLEDAFEGMKDIERKTGKQVEITFNGKLINSQMSFEEAEKTVVGQTAKEHYESIKNKPEDEINPLDKKYIEDYEAGAFDYEYVSVDEYMVLDDKLDYIKSKSQQTGMKYYCKHNGKAIKSDYDIKKALMEVNGWTEQEYDEIEKQVQEQSEKMKKELEMQEIEATGLTPEEYEAAKKRAEERTRKIKEVENNKKERDSLKDRVNSLSYELEVKRDDLESLNREEQEIEKNAIE